MNYLFFDTETTGKIINWKAPISKVDNFPRITQLGMMRYSDNRLIASHNFIIYPDGWTVPVEKFFIENGMSTDRCKEFGVPIRKALDQFLYEIANSDVLIAHNMAFDMPVVGAEMFRLGLKSSKILPKICTMQSSIKHCNLPRLKYPKLSELHFKLFGTEPEVLHDALQDVKTTAKCFFELKKLGII